MKKQKMSAPMPMASNTLGGVGNSLVAPSAIAAKKAPMAPKPPKSYLQETVKGPAKQTVKGPTKQVVRKPPKLKAY